MLSNDIRIESNPQTKLLLLFFKEIKKYPHSLIMWAYFIFLNQR